MPLGTEALLFQTGYLTITAEERRGGKALYRQGYPNREVRQSLNECLLRQATVLKDVAGVHAGRATAGGPGRVRGQARFLVTRLLVRLVV